MTTASWTNEEWRDVSGYVGRYQVSNLGRVRSLTYGLKPWKHNKGYRAVTLFSGNGTEKKLVHRLVAEAFLPNPDRLPQVNHKNGDKTDNRVENLEWCTGRANSLHNAYELGNESTIPKRPVVCLDTGTVFLSVTDAARFVGGCSQNISKVCQGKRKRHKGLRWAYWTEVEAYG